MELLVQELVDVLARIAASRAVEQRSAEAPSDPVRLTRAVLPQQLVESVADVLRRDPWFAGGVGFMVRNPSGATGFSADDAAAAMVRIVLSGESPDTAVDLLRVVLDSRETGGTLIMALWGVSIDAPADLSDRIQLLPLAQLPQSLLRDRLLALRPDPAESFGHTPLTAAPPLAALTMKVTVDPVLIRPATDSAERYWRDHEQTFSKMDGVRLALSALGPSAPLAAATWFEYDSPAFRWATAHEGTSWSRPSHEIVPLRWSHPVALEPESAAAVVRGFLKLENKSRDKVELALQRLNQAVRRHTDADKALELAIALEALLTDNQPGENTYKLGLRSALLTRGSREHRLKRRDLVSALYKLRNGVVHAGTIPAKVKVPSSGKTDSSWVIKQSMIAVAEIVHEVICLGEIPEDWHVWELGSEPIRPDA